jgi:hypothetical protein
MDTWPARALAIGFVLIALLWASSSPATSQVAGERRLLYVALDDAVKVFDIADEHRLVKRIPLGGYGRARGIQASIPRQRLYVSYLDSPAGGARLVAIDLQTDQVVWARAYPGADAVAITADGAKIFMSSGEGSARDYFYVVDAISGDQLDRISIYEQTHNGMIGPSQQYAYLSSVKHPYLVVVDVGTHQVLRRIGPFGAGIRPITINGRETLAFVNVNGLQGFEVADVASGVVLHRVAVTGFPFTPKPNEPNPSHGVGLTPDERELWVAGATEYVHIFDATKMPPVQIASVKLSRQPKWVSFSIDGRYAYPGSGDVVDVATRKVVGHYDYSKRQIEVDFRDNQVVQVADMYAMGQQLASQVPTAAPTEIPAATPSASSTPTPSATIEPPIESPGTLVRLALLLSGGPAPQSRALEAAQGRE